MYDSGMISAWIGVDVPYLYDTKLTFGELDTELDGVFASHS